MENGKEDEEFDEAALMGAVAKLDVDSVLFKPEPTSS